MDLSQSGEKLFIDGLLCRPGGVELTGKALRFCAFPEGAFLADLGCGKGLTVDYLRSLGFQAVGLDQNPSPNSFCQTGEAEALPYADSSLDGVFFECSFSKIARADKVLKEVRRVLAPSGRLIISDFYARQKASCFQGVLGRLDAKATWLKTLKDAGFDCLLFQDESAALRNLAAQILWERGKAGLAELYGCNGPDSLKAADCGYFLAVWGR